MSAEVAVRNPISDWDRGPWTWDLTLNFGLRAWDLGPGTWDLEAETRVRIWNARLI